MDRRAPTATAREEFHLVLLDNGRTNVLADPVGRQALRCIRCSACLNVCPVYDAPAGTPTGRSTPGRSARSSRRSSPASRARVAAVRVDSVRRLLRGLPGEDRHPQLLVHLRGRIVTETGTEPLGERAAMRLLLRILSDRHRYQAAQRALRLGRAPVRSRLARALPGPVGGWTSVRELPEIPERTFRQWWSSHENGSER